MVETADDQRMPSQGSKVGRRTASKPMDENSSNDLLSTGLHEYQVGYARVTANPVMQALKNFLLRSVMPLFLMASTPNIVFLIWFAAAHCDGSYACVGNVFREKSLVGGLRYIYGHVNAPSAPVIWTLIGYSVFALTIMRLLPGKTVYGPTTPKGHVPVYKDNGFACFATTMVTFVLLTIVLKTFFSVSPTLIYDRFDEVLAALNIFSILFCLFLYLKGLLAPSLSDSGSSGNIIFDYYWGMELYPRVLGFDVKVFTNCRFGMTVWPLLVCVFALKSYELYGFVDSMFVTTTLQLVYCTKFFWWEAGYMNTIDIMMDRAGYYICWGCLVYIPGLYASVSLYMVNHPVNLGLPLTAFLLALGVLSIYINYDADKQKLQVRSSDGRCLVWGRKPSIIRAKYVLDSGETRESILLASGWWGLSRHFHYIPEILLAFFWSVPALFHDVMPYTYVIWLVLLLTHRSYRDDTKCENKYGNFWLQYCRKVPHKIVPYIF
ncbi:7-dehydrocholesterol reductase-like isoform X2 [Pomacea canaliculata]|uniref:7-dehydrocholesterol reductase-like isoform X2 n=2 Tax=Pomacea canaliculata TaxID=400727 RepID=UPI000D72BF29|nr:7-dehydrocholesterol reductase-like isoform X2 [Pomacea canaliculata]